MTTGIVIFDLEGNLLRIKSGKFFSRPEISKVISRIGKPVIIASDVHSPPKLIEKIAAAFDAQLMTPGERLSRKEKAKIAKTYQKLYGKVWKNVHERDALIAGFYSWKRIRPRLVKLESKLRKMEINDKELKDRIREKVVIQGKKLNTVINELKNENKI